MTIDTQLTLASLDYMPYLNEAGELSNDYAGTVGVYAIFDRDRQLQYIGYSRDVVVSLKQHLVRRPQQCYWVKVQPVSKPSRPALEGMRDAWIAEHGSTPPGNGVDEAGWTQAIDAKVLMTDAEKAAYSAADELGRIKTLKQVARRVEVEVLAMLDTRGVNMPIRFDPKLKEEGLLGLK